MSGIVIGVVVGIESIIEGLRQIVTKWAFDMSFTYQKVACSNLFCLEAHAGFFILSMKGNLMFFYCDLFRKSSFPF